MRAPDERSRFLFVHVMKTGGTSLVMQLLAQFEPREIYPDAELDRRHINDAEPYASLSDLAALSDERRAAIRFYAGHFPFMARELIGPDAITLTVLRDPVDRTLSVLKHFKRLYPRFRDLPLDEIYDDPVVFELFVENYQTKVFALSAEDRPIVFASSLPFAEVKARLEQAPPRGPRAGPAGSITVDRDRLSVAKSNLAQVDLVGSNEDFSDFIAQLRTGFGWWSAGVDDAVRANVSSEPWDASAALRARIARENEIDVEFYRYGLELIRARRR